MELEDNPCEGVHIGKNSAGWVFTFQAHPNLKLKSVNAWKEFLQEGYIYDEYGVLIPVKEFWEIVEASKEPDDFGEPYNYVNWPEDDKSSHELDNYNYMCEGYMFTVSDFC